MTKTVEELLQELADNELSNVIVGTGAEEGSAIQRSNRAAAVTAINDCLIDLHTQLILLRKSVLIVPMEGTNEYILDSKYAQSYKGMNQSPIKYIEDSQEKPFQNDVIKILGVFGSATGDKGVNYIGSNGSGIELTSPNSFRIIGNVDAALLVKYQAIHPRVVEQCRSVVPEGGTIEDQVFLGYTTSYVDVPHYVYPMIKNYVAYRLYGRMNTAEAVQLSNRYFMNYQQALIGLINTNTTNQTMMVEEPSLFEERGWV